MWGFKPTKIASNSKKGHGSEYIRSALTETNKGLCKNACCISPCDPCTYEGCKSFCVNPYGSQTKHIVTCFFRLQAKRHMVPWVPLLRAEQETDKLVSSQIGTLQSTWIILTKKCSIQCHQALDLGCILGLLRGQHLSSRMISGMGYLLEQTQVILATNYICRVM